MCREDRFWSCLQRAPSMTVHLLHDAVIQQVRAGRYTCKPQYAGKGRKVSKVVTRDPCSMVNQFRLTDMTGTACLSTVTVGGGSDWGQEGHGRQHDSRTGVAAGAAHYDCMWHVIIPGATGLCTLGFQQQLQ